MDVYAVWRMLSLRRYRGRLSYRESGDEPMVNIKDSLPNTWKTIENDFICLWACKTTHASFDIMSSPHSAFDDGYFQIIIIRKGGRADLLKMFLNMENGGHADMDAVEIIKCKAFRLEPLNASGGNLSLDGEEIGYGLVQGSIDANGYKLLGA